VDPPSKLPNPNSERGGEGKKRELIRVGDKEGKENHLQTIGNDTLRGRGQLLKDRAFN